MTWIAVAKKEYLENVRNAWVIAVTALFLFLTLLASYITRVTTSGLSDASGLAPLGATLSGLDSVGGFLLPILALTVGFGAISGERESGSLALLVAQPLRRAEIVLGKFLGLFGVLATAALLGFGVGGLVVLSRTGGSADDAQALLLFLFGTLLWGAAWTSVTLLLSAWFQRRGTTIAGAISVWFVSTSLVWNILSLILLISAAGTGSLGASLNGRGGASLPQWLIVTQWINPTAAYEGFLATSVSGYQTVAAMLARAGGITLYAAPGFLVALALWIALPLYGAWRLFESRDV
jgi:ABC-2 type transport system permease protein